MSKTTEQSKVMRKVYLAWKKWNDKATKKEEKQSIKELIEKTCKEYNLTIDWKNGTVDIAQSTGKATGKEETTDTVWTTKELAQYISQLQGKELTTKNLRRHLRKMDIYNDGKNTNYRWTGKNDPIIKDILKHLGIKVA